MSLLLGQMFSRCNVPSPPAAGTYQLMFARRPTVAGGVNDPLPTGHWGGTGRDTASTFYGDLADLTHVKTAVVYDRWGNDGNIYDFGFKVVSSINTNTTEQNTCQVQLDTEGENPFGGFCFEGITGDLYISFGIKCSFYSGSTTFPILRINLYAGRGGTDTPLQTWDLHDLRGIDSVGSAQVLFAYDWAGQVVQLQLDNDVVDIVSNRWDGAIVEFIAAPNGWNEEYHHGAATGDLAEAYPGWAKICWPDKDIEGSASTGMRLSGGLGSGGQPLPVEDTMWECLGASWTRVVLNNQTYSPAYFEIGLEKPTAGNHEWSGVGAGSGYPQIYSPWQAMSIPGYWDETMDRKSNYKKLIVNFVGAVPGPDSNGVKHGRSVTVTVTADGSPVAEVFWDDDTNEWDTTPSSSAHDYKAHYFLSESDWGALTRYEQERIQVKVECTGYDEIYPGDLECKIDAVNITTGPSAWMGIYMPRGSNEGTYLNWTGYESPDEGVVWYGDPLGLNRLSMIMKIEETE